MTEALEKNIRKVGNIVDTGVLGLDAARAYVSQFDTLTENDISWN